MKKYFILLFLALLLNSLYSQNKQQFDERVDSVLNMNWKNHVYQDTLWVLDSSLQYKMLNSTNELTYQRTYKVLSRNYKGNVLNSLDWVHESFPYGISQNSVSDSIIYFNGIDIKKHYSNAWNSVEQIWIDNRYEEYEAPGLPKEIFYKGFFNSSQQYLYGSRKMYKNSNDKADTLFTDNYIYETNSWQKNTKEVTFYDDQGIVKSHVIYIWKNSSWKARNKYQFIFESNKLVEWIVLNPDTINNIWQNYLLVSYFYTSTGNPDTTFIKYWNNQSNSWHVNNKEIYSYDNLNRLINQLALYYDTGTQQMENDWNYHYDYTDGNKTEIYKTWIMASGTWRNQYLLFTSYITDDIVDTLEQISWNYYSQQWEKERLTVNKFDNHLNTVENINYIFSINDWIIMSKTDYYWSPFIPNSINEISTNALAVYPNPATNRVTFALEDIFPKQDQEISIKIFNISGQKVTEIPLKEGKVIWDCSYEKPGIYIYSAVVNGLVVTGKVIVK